MHHQVERAGKAPQVSLHGCSHAAPNAVALYSASQNLAHGESHAWTRAVLALAVKDRDVPGEMLFAMLVDRLKIRVLQKS